MGISAAEVSVRACVEDGGNAVRVRLTIWDDRTISYGDIAYWWGRENSGVFKNMLSEGWGKIMCVCVCLMLFVM